MGLDGEAFEFVPGKTSHVVREHVLKPALECICDGDLTTNAAPMKTSLSVPDFSSWVVLCCCTAGEYGCMACLTHAVKKLDVDPNECFDPSHRYVIHHICMNGHVDALKLLLKHGSQVNVQNTWQATPIYAAAKYGHFEICRVLVENGADFTISNNYGATPLYIAADRGHTKVVEFLSKQGSSVNTFVDFGSTPITAAAKHGHEETVKKLIQLGSTVPLLTIYACLRKKELEICKYLLEKERVDFTKIPHHPSNKNVFEILTQQRENRYKKIYNTVIKLGFPGSLSDLICKYDREIMCNAPLWNILSKHEDLSKIVDSPKPKLSSLAQRCPILRT